jgi:hypothetical protein
MMEAVGMSECLLIFLRLHGTISLKTAAFNDNVPTTAFICEISSSHGGDFDVQCCLLGYTALMMEAVCTSETSVDNHFTRQYIPEDNYEHLLGAF